MDSIEELQAIYMNNASKNKCPEEINELREIWKSATWFYQKQSRELHQLRLELYEYIGLDDTYIRTKPGLKKLTKDELVDIILRQRAAYKELLNEVDTNKREEFINKFEELVMLKAPNS